MYIQVDLWMVCENGFFAIHKSLCVLPCVSECLFFCVSTFFVVYIPVCNLVMEYVCVCVCLCQAEWNIPNWMDKVVAVEARNAL